VWLIAVRKIADFDPARGGLMDWLRGIAALQLRNSRRRMLRRETSPLDASNEPAAIAEPDGDLTLADALAEISDRHEAVLRAKYLDGWSVREIARRWNETPKAIESLLTRARQAFREAYERMLRVD
jgi:RNA polymerase sigma-70 factor (ECF subfamily)